MKKLVLLSSVLACLSLGSCKKDYTCSCTTTAGANTATTTSTIKDTESKAKETCEKGSSTTTLAGITSTTKCEIK